MYDYGVTTQQIQSMNNYRPTINILHGTGKTIKAFKVSVFAGICSLKRSKYNNDLFHGFGEPKTK